MTFSPAGWREPMTGWRRVDNKKGAEGSMSSRRLID
jgi:hypothetical protein